MASTDTHLDVDIYLYIGAHKWPICVSVQDCDSVIHFQHGNVYSYPGYLPGTSLVGDLHLSGGQAH